MKTEYAYIDIIGEIEIESEDVGTLYHSGQCYEDVKSLVDKYSPQFSHVALLDKVQAVEQYGMELSEDEKEDETELDIKLLWLAAGDIFEMRED